MDPDRPRTDGPSARGTVAGRAPRSGIGGRSQDRPAAAPYRTSYTRGSVTTGYTTGEVPSNGVVTFDLRTNTANFPPDTYFFTIRAGNAVKTVTFRLTS